MSIFKSESSIYKLEELQAPSGLSSPPLFLPFFSLLSFLHFLLYFPLPPYFLTLLPHFFLCIFECSESPQPDMTTVTILMSTLSTSTLDS